MGYNRNVKEVNILCATIANDCIPYKQSDDFYNLCNKKSLGTKTI